MCVCVCLCVFAPVCVISRTPRPAHADPCKTYEQLDTIADPPKPTRSPLHAFKRAHTHAHLHAGGVTLTGSMVAFAKLQGLMKSAPLNLPGKNARARALPQARSNVQDTHRTTRALHTFTFTHALLRLHPPTHAHTRSHAHVHIGGVTLTGSMVAFAKLQGLMKSAPLNLPGKNALNASMALANVAAMGAFMHDPTSTVGMAALASTAGVWNVVFFYAPLFLFFFIPPFISLQPSHSQPPRARLERDTNLQAGHTHNPHSFQPDTLERGTIWQVRHLLD